MATSKIPLLVGELFTLDSTGVTSIPHNTEKTIYSKVLPKGAYLLSAKLYTMTDNFYVESNGLRVQSGGVYATLSGIVISDGVNPITIRYFQFSGSTITRPYSYDTVRVMKLH